MQIDAAATQQIIHGFGGATAFLPTTPLTNGDLDALFGNGPGQIGLTLLRIRVASDADWRAIELSNAKGALARGANVIATPWSPPAAMKSNNSIIGGQLNLSAYADYATYLNTFANYLAFNSAPLYAISIQNEPDINVTYESCAWTPAQLLAFCGDNAGAITATKVIMPESCQFSHALSDPTLNDDTAAANVDIIGGHIYGGGLAPYPLAAEKGKEVWMTEHLDLSTDWAGALATAKEIHDCLAAANFNAYLWWYLKRYYGPLGEDGVVTKRGNVMAQFSRFIRPGFVRVGATANPATDVYVSAYKREKLVIVAINQGETDTTQAFSISNATLETVTSWVTSSTASLEAQPAIQVAGGSFTATLPAASVTTFVGDLVLGGQTVVTPQQVAVSRGDGTNQIINLSSRGYTSPGLAAMTGGFVIVGPANTQKTVLLRGAAFSLYQFGIKTPLAKPLLTVYDSSGRTIAIQRSQQTAADLFLGNVDNSNSKLQPIFNQVGAFQFVPDGSDGALRGDTAIVLKLTPNSYTFTVSSDSDTPPNATADGDSLGEQSTTGSGLPNATAGVVLLEVYDISMTDGARLINISTRGQVVTGEGQMIAGFVVNGSGHKRLLIRGAGPALNNFGITSTVGDPYLTVFDSSGDTLITDAGWNYGAQGTQIAQLTAADGAFALSDPSADSAAIVLVTPGQYTASVQSISSTLGIALVEVYDAP